LLVDLTQYPTLRSLTDDLYVQHLRNRFKPYSYGREWIIGNTENYFVPPAWVLSNPPTTVNSLDPEWLDQVSLTDLIEDQGPCSRELRVIQAPFKPAYAIVTRSSTLLCELRSDIKSHYHITEDEAARWPVRGDSPELRGWAGNCVVTPHWYFDDPNGSIFRAQC